MADIKEQKIWSNASILLALQNPSKKSYQIEHVNPELTFLGVPKQPDFAKVRIIFYPGNTIIELRSLKLYFQQFREKVISYERLINVIYDDLMSVYDPKRLKIVIVFNSRGGIRSRITIDSHWRKAINTKK